MKKLYEYILDESLLSSNNASIENDLIEWADNYWPDCKGLIRCEKTKNGYDLVIDSFEHQPHIQGITFRQRDLDHLPKYLCGLYFMHYETRQSKGVKTPMSIRIANAKSIETLDFSEWRFEQEEDNRWWKDMFGLYFSSVKELKGLPSSNKKVYYTISQCRIGKMNGIRCPEASLEMIDGDFINPLNITDCEFNRLILNDLSMGHGLAYILQNKIFGSSVFEGEEYIRHGNVFEMCKEYQYIVDHLLTKNKITSLQIWESPGKTGRTQYWNVYKHKEWGYCLKRR